MNHRTALTLVLGAALLACSGCVWLRLNTLRKQMRDFAAHVEVEDAEEGLRFGFKKPVLKPGDLTWLTGFEPSESVRTNDTRVDTYRLLKERGTNSTEEAGAFDLDCVFSFDEDKRLREAHLPPTLRPVLNAGIVRELTRDIGDADIGERERSADWRIRNVKVLPGMRQMSAALGPPTEARTTDTEFQWTYRYRIEGADEDLPPIVIELRYGNPKRNFLSARARVGRIRLRNARNEAGQWRMNARRGSTKADD